MNYFRRASKTSRLGYKESECTEDGPNAAPAYTDPEKLYEHFGVSYEIKQKRDGIINAVSAADIRNRGTKVINPFIGVIPSLGELEDELEELLEAM